MGAGLSRAAPGRERPCAALVLFFSRFFTRTLASQRGLHTLFLAGLQVKGVTLDLLDDVFLLHLALETPEGVFQRLALLQSNFRQT